MVFYGDWIIGIPQHLPVNCTFNVSATNVAILLKLSLHASKTSEIVIDSESPAGRKLGGFGYKALKCTSLRSSAWELRKGLGNYIRCVVP